MKSIKKFLLTVCTVVAGFAAVLGLTSWNKQLTLAETLSFTPSLTIAAGQANAQTNGIYLTMTENDIPCSSSGTNWTDYRYVSTDGVSVNGTVQKATLVKFNSTGYFLEGMFSNVSVGKSTLVEIDGTFTGNDYTFSIENSSFMYTGECWVDTNAYVVSKATLSTEMTMSKNGIYFSLPSNDMLYDSDWSVRPRQRGNAVKIDNAIKNATTEYDYSGIRIVKFASTSYYLALVDASNEWNNFDILEGTVISDGTG